MKPLILTILALIALSSIAVCRAQSPAGETADPRPPGKPPAAYVVYLCPGAQDFSARFSEDGESVRLKVAGQPHVDLSSLPSGTGFAYGDSYYELRGRGREVTLTIHGSSTLRCRAAGQPGEPSRSFSDGKSTITLLPDGTFRERVAGSVPVTARLGIWTEEVDGGMRLVLHEGSRPRRSFRPAEDGALVSADNSILRPVTPVDPIDESFRLDGMFRVGPVAGLFAECVTDRTFYMIPNTAEAEMDRQWTQSTPGPQTQIHASIIGRFTKDGELSAERFLGMERGENCPPSTPLSASLRGTNWRVASIDGKTLKVERPRELPTLTLDDNGRYSGWTGCNRTSGTYTLDAKGLRFDLGTMTRMACAPPADDIEHRFLATLAAITQAHLAAATLELQDDSGTRRLRLEARGR